MRSGGHRRAQLVPSCAIVLASTMCAAAARGGQTLPPEAASALADMDFARLKASLEADGIPAESLAVCGAMAKAFGAACRRVADGSWKPSARDLAGVPGEIRSVGASGVSVSSAGMAMTVPWRSIAAARRQQFLAAGAARGDRDGWLARVGYAAWSGLSDRAAEEAAAAAKDGVELPGFLAQAVDELATSAAGARDAARSATKADATRRPRSPGPGLLGSPDFRATPERPVGWRGDWSGRFPGATPPTTWSRRVRGVTTDLTCCAARPGGAAPGADARPLEYFTIKDWLVAGPFAVEDPARGIDKDFLGGEAAARPAEGAKAYTKST